MYLDKFIELIEKDQAYYFSKHYPNLLPPRVKIINGNKYIKINVGDSGKYMIDKSTGIIHGIKGYGVINKKKSYGTLNTINEYYWGDYAPIKKKGE